MLAKTLKTEGVKGQSLRLMFQDEASFGRITDHRNCWAPYPIRPGVKASLVREYVYAYANDFIIMILDGASSHRAKNLVIPGNIRLIPLPPYSPELNPVEHFGTNCEKKSSPIGCLIV